MAAVRRSVIPRVLFIAVIAAIVIGVQVPTWLTARAATPAALRGLAPGLSLKLETPDGKAVDVRLARLVSLGVPAGSPVSPMFPPGPFKATWTGILGMKINDEYRFAASGSGDLTVTINDKTVLDLHGDFGEKPSDLIPLKKGRNKLVVVYTPPASGDASIKLLWAADEKMLDPISPVASNMATLLHEPADTDLAAHAGVRMGRDILITSRCAACHADVTGTAPDLKQDAPNLTDLGKRLNRDYVAAWITNPKAIRPSAAMPRVFHDQPASKDPTVDPRAADIAAYLCPAPVSSETTPDDSALLIKGNQLFVSLGCLNCHVAPGLEDSDPTLTRVPLKYVKAQFTPGSLVEFLKKPEAHYAWSRMPNFHLSDDEAKSLAGWLISRCTPGAVPAAPAGDAGRGKVLFASSGCLSCHNQEGATSPKPSAPAMADLSKACTGVDYAFTEEQKKALAAVGAVDWKASLSNDPATDFATRQMAVLRCTSCHTLDSQDSVWSNMDDEIASLRKGLPVGAQPTSDQTPPPLTWAGEKLRTEWMSDFIAGKVQYKPRDWMVARMPSFPARANEIAAGLSLTHANPLTEPPAGPINPQMVQIAYNLMAQTGYGCVKCHSAAKQPALAPFEAQAPNLANVSDRLRHDYFIRWMNNPQYFLRSTKMPAFAINNGNKAQANALNGNANAQFEAIWQFLLQGWNLAPPN